MLSLVCPVPLLILVASSDAAFSPGASAFVLSDYYILDSARFERSRTLMSPPFLSDADVVVETRTQHARTYLHVQLTDSDSFEEAPAFDDGCEAHLLVASHL